MAFIGQQPLSGVFKSLDTITPDGNTSYSLLYNSAPFYPGQAERLMVSVNGVVQAPGLSFNIDGSTITFSEAVANTDVIDFVIGMGEVGNATVPADGSVTLTKIANGAVTADKLNSTLDLSGKTITNLDASGTGFIPPAGSVVQVQRLLMETEGSYSIGTSDTDVPNMSLSITPKYDNSWIRIDVRYFSETLNTYNVTYNIHRNGTKINSRTNGSRSFGLSMATITYHDDYNSTPEMMHLSTIDTTGTTANTSVSYKLVAISDASTTSYYNRCAGATDGVQFEIGSSEIILTEIKQ